MAFQDVKTGITEWYTYYCEHKDNGRSLEQEVAFLKQCVEGLWDLMATTAQELEALKRKPVSEDSMLFRPRGVILR